MLDHATAHLRVGTWRSQPVEGRGLTVRVWGMDDDGAAWLQRVVTQEPALGAFIEVLPAITEACELRISLGRIHPDGTLDGSFPVLCIRGSALYDSLDECLAAADNWVGLRLPYDEEANVAMVVARGRSSGSQSGAGSPTPSAGQSKVPQFDLRADGQEIERVDLAEVWTRARRGDLGWDTWIRDAGRTNWTRASEWPMWPDNVTRPRPPTANQWLLLHSDTTSGPHATRDIQRWLLAGELPYDLHLSRVGDPDWAPLGQWPGIPASVLIGLESSRPTLHPGTDASLAQHVHLIDSCLSGRPLGEIATHTDNVTAGSALELWTRLHDLLINEFGGEADEPFYEDCTDRALEAIAAEPDLARPYQLVEHDVAAAWQSAGEGRRRLLGWMTTAIIPSDLAAARAWRAGLVAPVYVCQGWRWRGIDLEALCRAAVSQEAQRPQRAQPPPATRQVSRTDVTSPPSVEATPTVAATFPEGPGNMGFRRPATAHHGGPPMDIDSAGRTGSPRRRWLVVGMASVLLVVASAAGLRLLSQPQPAVESVTRTPHPEARSDDATSGASQEPDAEPPSATGLTCAQERDAEDQAVDECTREDDRARADAQVPDALPLALRQLRIGLPQPAVVLGSDERRAAVVVYREGISQSDVRTEIREWAQDEGWDLMYEATDVHARLSACDVYARVDEPESSANYLSVQFLEPQGSAQLHVIEEYGVTGPFIEVTVGEWLEECGAEPLPASEVEEEPPVWVAQLASVPTDAGQDQLEAVYQDVLSQVPTAIVIASDDFASLRPGYYVVVATDSFADGYAALEFCEAHGRTETTACVGRYLSNRATDSVRQCMFDDRRSEVCTRP